MKKYLCALSCFAILVCLLGCDDSYENDLKNGMRKSFTGEKMTSGERKAYDDYNDWRD